MIISNPLSEFLAAAKLLDLNIFREKELEIWIGEKLNAQVLKIYNKSWTNDPTNPVEAKTRIFFSVWTTNDLMVRRKLMYTLHSLKIRELPGYRLESRKFAMLFREKLQPVKTSWENIRLDLGPLSLMEGWTTWKEEGMSEKIANLANQFLEIEPLLSEALLKFKKQA